MLNQQHNIPAGTIQAVGTKRAQQNGDGSQLGESCSALGGGGKESAGVASGRATMPSSDATPLANLCGDRRVPLGPPSPRASRGARGRHCGAASGTTTWCIGQARAELSGRFAGLVRDCGRGETANRRQRHWGRKAARGRSGNVVERAYRRAAYGSSDYPLELERWLQLSAAAGTALP